MTDALTNSGAPPQRSPLHVPEAIPQLSHAELVEVAAKWLKRQGCNVVLTERFAGNDHRGECPDAIGWFCSDFSSVVVECKVSLSDFIADASKPWRTGPAMGFERWFLVPRGLPRPKAWPSCWGLLEWDRRVVRCVIKPLPFQDRSITHEARLLLAELRIFHAQGITYRKIGSGTPSLSEASPVTAQERERQEDTLTSETPS
jgi:hypothetical protein